MTISTVWRYASAAYAVAMCLSVRSSICLLYLRDPTFSRFDTIPTCDIWTSISYYNKCYMLTINTITSTQIKWQKQSLVQ